MTAKELALIMLVTSRLRSRGYRYLAEIENGELVIRVFKGLDRS